MIDTHAHIYDPQFADDRPTMLQHALDQGVTQIWMPNCDQTTVPDMLALADEAPDRYRPMMGLHPCYVTDTLDAELQAVETWLNRRDFLAIGEIGLDFYWDLTHVERQFVAFRTQLQWAAERRMFVSIHVRSGHDRNAFAEAADLIETLNLPDRQGRRHGIFHCFVGTLTEAQRAVDLGFLLGIGGVSTFKNGGLDKVLPHMDPAYIVLETDAPYLAPVPYRGKRNEPAYLRQIARRVAELMGLTEEEIARQTTENAVLIMNYEL
jgi:TatD DNase family protein